MSNMCILRIERVSTSLYSHEGVVVDGWSTLIGLRHWDLEVSDDVRQVRLVSAAGQVACRIHAVGGWGGWCS